MPQLSFWQSILLHLHQPEYIHVLLNPVPIYGLAFGCVALVVGMILRNWPAQFTGLLLIFIAAVSVIPVIHYGREGYDTIEASRGTDQSDAWIDAHAQRGMRSRPAYYALMLVSLAALAFPWKWRKSARILNILTLALAIFDLGLGAWIGYAGGQATHSEFNKGSGMPIEPVGGYDKMQ
jgi:hypothetical protein